MVSIKKFVAGYLRTNSYLVSSDIDRQAVLIDAGGGFDKIEKYITENSLNLTALLLTHGHFDHITIAKKLQDTYKLKIYVHKNDEDMLHTENNLARMVGLTLEQCRADIVLTGMETLNFGEMSFEVIHTPGHSRGSVIYILNKQYVFSGDTLFHESYGATHFLGGNMDDMKKSLTTILSLEGDLPVYCGHQEDTTLNHERQYNPINYV